MEMDMEMENTIGYGNGHGHINGQETNMKIGMWKHLKD